LINQQLVERCLARRRLFDKMWSDEEWKTIANMVEYLEDFQDSNSSAERFKALFCYSEPK